MTPAMYLSSIVPEAAIIVILQRGFTVNQKQANQKYT